MRAEAARREAERAKRLQAEEERQAELKKVRMQGGHRLRNYAPRVLHHAYPSAYADPDIASFFCALGFSSKSRPYNWKPRKRHQGVHQQARKRVALRRWAQRTSPFVEGNCCRRGCNNGQLLVLFRDWAARPRNLQTTSRKLSLRQRLKLNCAAAAEPAAWPLAFAGVVCTTKWDVH